MSPFVFCDEEGKTYRDVRKSFFTACKKSDIKDFRFHDARHTYASHLVMKGEGLYTVQKLLGHKKPDMTLRYSHLSPDHLHRAVAKLDDLIPSTSLSINPEPFDKLRVVSIVEPQAPGRARGASNGLMDTQVDTQSFQETRKNLEFSQHFENTELIDCCPDSSVGRAMD